MSKLLGQTAVLGDSHEIYFRRAGHYNQRIPIPQFHPKVSCESAHDTETGILLGIPRSAMCVQRFDDSLNSAIHITYRISLRSSSMREPRDPLLKVVLNRLLKSCVNLSEKFLRMI